MPGLQAVQDHVRDLGAGAVPKSKIPSGHAAIWLFLQIGGPFCGCPNNKSPTTGGSTIGPLIFGNSHINYTWGHVAVYTWASNVLTLGSMHEGCLLLPGLSGV